MSGTAAIRSLSFSKNRTRLLSTRDVAIARDRDSCVQINSTSDQSFSRYKMTRTDTEVFEWYLLGDTDTFSSRTEFDSAKYATETAQGHFASCCCTAELIILRHNTFSRHCQDHYGIGDQQCTDDPSSLRETNCGFRIQRHRRSLERTSIGCLVIASTDRHGDDGKDGAMSRVPVKILGL